MVFVFGCESVRDTRDLVTVLAQPRKTVSDSVVLLFIQALRDIDLMFVFIAWYYLPLAGD